MKVLVFKKKERPWQEVLAELKEQAAAELDKVANMLTDPCMVDYEWGTIPAGLTPLDISEDVDDPTERDLWEAGLVEL